ncbi:MAG: phosphoglycerate mutase [Methyloligella sp.]|nr:MAG: phosphoglycerate mutase [Methyloligella sp.]
MLDLYILRHAKSSWSDETLDDFDRPLNKRGKQNAILMGRYLRDAKLSPDMVLCSKAKRCKQTLKRLLAEDFCVDQQVFSNKLYLASSNELISVIKKTPNLIRSLMIIGHNPGLESLLDLLIKDKTSSDYLLIASKFPTCAFVHIQIDTDCWTKLAPNSGTLYCTVTPKQHLSQDD